MELTDWLEGCVPVRPGTYDVIEAAQPGLKSENVSQAEWGTRFGTTGFWKVSELKQEDGGAASRHYVLIKARAWRGQTRGENHAFRLGGRQ